jgi:transcriptional regulator with XRE-family HTH domain
MKNLSDERINQLKKETPIFVGNLIKQARSKRKISQTQLAEAVGKDRQYLYKIESGKVTPNISTIAILADALGLSLEQLIKGG